MIVYTAITSGKDTLKENQNTEGAEFVAFLDTPTESKMWDIRPVTEISPDPVRNAKQYKLLPHKYFDTEYSLWIDGSITLLDPMSKLVDLYLKDTDIALHKHYMRSCLYDEAMSCGSYMLDDPEIISKQVARYFAQEKYPRKNGLAECTIILRRHTPKIAELNELWWDEVTNGSRRDQISFNYCCWKLGVKYTEMEGTVYNSPHFAHEKHTRIENPIIER